MSFKDFSILSSGGHLVQQWNQLSNFNIKGHERNISVKFGGNLSSALKMITIAHLEPSAELKNVDHPSPESQVNKEEGFIFLKNRHFIFQERFTKLIYMVLI